MGWLKQCCKEALAPENLTDLKDMEATRKEWWPPSETNEYSHLRLSDFTDEVAALPPGELPVSFPLIDPSITSRTPNAKS